MGRPTLRKLGRNTLKIFRAAVAANEGVIDVGDEDKSYSNGQIAMIMNHSMFHGRMVDDDGGILDEKAMLDIGTTTHEQKKQLVSKSIRDAEKCGISSEGKGKLSKLLTTFNEVPRVRLGNDLLQMYRL